MNFLLAGRDTTAQLLTSVFRLLDLHHDVRNRLEDEIDQVLGDACNFSFFSFFFFVLHT